MKQDNSIEKIKELEEQVTIDIDKLPKRSFRDCVYGRIDVSVTTMDKILFTLVVMLIIAIILGFVL